MKILDSWVERPDCFCLGERRSAVQLRGPNPALMNSEQLADDPESTMRKCTMPKTKERRRFMRIALRVDDSGARSLEAATCQKRRQAGGYPVAWPVEANIYLLSRFG
jgi:hypothetical protein